MLQPSLSFFGFTLHEPITVITDLILSGLCLILFNTTRKSRANLWSLFFLSMAFATFFGALGHGLYDHKNNNLQWISRTSGIVSVFFASLASVQFLPIGRLKGVIRFMVYLQLCIALFLIFQNNSFRIVATNGTVGFAGFVGVIHIYLFKLNQKGAGWIILGILVNAVAGLIHKFTLAPHKWFNHNDLGHVIMVLGLILLAKGAIQLQRTTQT